VIPERLADELLTFWLGRKISMMSVTQIELARLLAEDWHLSLIELEEAVRALVP
jgi:hypothetical protein